MSFSNANLFLAKERRFLLNPSQIEQDSSSQIPFNQFSISGQGVLIFKVSLPPKEMVRIVFSDIEVTAQNTLSIELAVGTLYLRRNENLLAEQPNSGLTEHERAFYWVSLDAQNQIIRFGTGEARMETESFSFAFTHQDKPFLESLSRFDYQQDLVSPLRVLRDPILAHVPLVVKNTDELTMDMVATSAIMPKAHLSPIAQKLFDTIAGKHFVLNTPDFPDFSEAIEYSIATPGCWCFQKLEEKSGEFGDKNPKKVYLRITLGQNGGESPGIPFVMEIWPSGCYSPIHNHAGANAVIRVLHGEIKVKLFPFLGAEKPFGERIFSAGDITWISPTLNQFHQLENPNEAGPTCMTIQCYMYDESDTGHYDYFDYLDDHNQINQYEPDSDMDFLAFKAQMRKEWLAK